MKSIIYIYKSLFSEKAWRNLPSNTDVLGFGLPSDNNFQPITSFASIALLGNEIVVGVTLLGYGGKHDDLLSLRINCSKTDEKKKIFSLQPWQSHGCYKMNIKQNKLQYARQSDTYKVRKRTGGTRGPIC